MSHLLEGADSPDFCVTAVEALVNVKDPLKKPEISTVCDSPLLVARN